MNSVLSVFSQNVIASWCCFNVLFSLFGSLGALFIIIIICFEFIVCFMIVVSSTIDIHLLLCYCFWSYPCLHSKTIKTTHQLNHSDLSMSQMSYHQTNVLSGRGLIYFWYKLQASNIIICTCINADIFQAKANMSNRIVDC